MTAQAEYMREYRKTPRGATITKVQTRAKTLAVEWVRVNRPDLWDDILNQAWLELAGRLPGRGRPRGVA